MEKQVNMNLRDDIN